MIVQDLRFGVIGWGYWGPKIARNLDYFTMPQLAMVADEDATSPHQTGSKSTMDTDHETA